jgi:hypothetical protein
MVVEPLVRTIAIPGCRNVPGAVTVTVEPRAPVAGEKAGVLGIVGAGLLTVKVPEDPELPSKGLVTFTSHVEVPVVPVPT